MAYDGDMASSGQAGNEATFQELWARREEIKARRTVVQDQLGMVVAEMMAREVKAMVPGARYLDLVQSPKMDYAVYWELGYLRDAQGQELLEAGSEETRQMREFFNSHYAHDYNDCFGGRGGGLFDLDRGRVVVEGTGIDSL
jgi:hypothetical protein